jgi:hypothetical protein
LVGLHLGIQLEAAVVVRSFFPRPLHFDFELDALAIVVLTFVRHVEVKGHRILIIRSTISNRRQWETYDLLVPDERPSVVVLVPVVEIEKPFQYIQLHRHHPPLNQSLLYD